MNKLEMHRKAVDLFISEFQKHGFKIDQTAAESAGETFIARRKNKYTVKVKSSTDYRYNFILKKHIQPHGSLYVGFVHFLTGGNPHLYLIKSTEWLSPNQLLKSRDYPGLASEPEYGLQLSRRNLPLLEQHSFNRIVSTLL